MVNSAFVRERRTLLVNAVHYNGGAGLASVKLRVVPTRRGRPRDSTNYFTMTSACIAASALWIEHS